LHSGQLPVVSFNAELSALLPSYTYGMVETVRVSAAHSNGHREVLVARGRRLEYLTIGWNTFEAVVALATGVVAGSVALVGFGLDSAIETSSAVILLWRLRADKDPTRREQSERTARRMVGICFLLLAAYIAIESIRRVWTRETPARSIPGLLIAFAAVIPLLARAKRRVARELGSRALHSDSRQADFCAYLSAILLLGLALQFVFGRWWIDPLAALMMVPIIAREGVQGLRAQASDDCNPQAN
jgi:divalent metal cation (Fe/Co/Zn/Cd) transporter